MAETNATILIPDISGFTEFMTTTELAHSTHALNYLIDAMVEAVGQEYEVSEIEGDAVLLIKKGEAPSKKEILDTCIKIFNAFHFRRKCMELHTVCPCGACQAIINLTLKFVVHHGPVAEIKVGRFVKQSGPEMIVAHRLLKNSIESHEYLLMTEKLLQCMNDAVEGADMEWNTSYEDYASIGKVNYQFALLSEARRKVPEPPEPDTDYRTDTTSYFEISIDANYFDVYAVVKNIPARPGWVPGLQAVEQDFPEVFIGSIHRCTFEDYEAVISPLRMVISEDGIMYAESFKVKGMNLSLVYEFVVKKSDEKCCTFGSRFLNANESPLPEEVNAKFFDQTELMAYNLKAYCEKI